HVFGLTDFVLVVPEKRKKLDEREVKGWVIGHLNQSKGWTFWIPATKKMVLSAWADFRRNSLSGLRHTNSPIRRTRKLQT
ncbi:uncharacterized protein VP01_3501g2, partial [Puccinia sorghi]